MTYISVAGRRWPSLLAAVFSCIALAACGSASDSGNDGGGDAGIDGPMGCLVQDFRGQPDVLVFPLPPLQAVPGTEVEFSVFVDKDTRLVKATFMGASRLDPTAFAQPPSETLMVPTTGNAMIDFAIPVNSGGRYYVDMELCGLSCDELRVVYTLDRAFAGEVANETPQLLPINNPYERIVYQGDTEISSSNTCDKPRSVAMQN